ncbi:glutathione ABC transporter substrate-binding protein [Alkaliphilus sp. B6464]|uniref:glutathione ABC transporter substrate-binding protein n=1 Tax=Alkaliphilus sp. B6464 TaxID=2731219 RepID=UPI001BA8432D|nr:glutathione ABC transporter substrate-binding protein [Alkaliphilus sp. B6464]QUH18775.1 glutathione ABC transporter substrate-binding protein [Alkaliphilus sp. B6464]
MKAIVKRIAKMLIFTMVFIGSAVPLTYADTLRVAQGGDARILDPHGSNDNISSRVIKQINETLVVQDENMELQPGLAESWEKIDDLTFEFKLKQGVKFHNGEELKASDVKFTLLRAIESPNVGHIVGVINKDGIEILDDYTIRISTIEPFAPLLAHLAHTGSSILNEKAVTEAGDDYGLNPVGTGPFRFKSWVSGDEITLTKFEEYYGEKAKVEEVKFKNIVEATNRRINLETGEIDIAYDILASDIKSVEENKELTLYRDANLSTSYIGFNVQNKPFDDVRVRQAINYAVDVDLIIEAVMEGVGQQSNGPLGPNVWGSNQELQPYEYNVEKAKELMKEAGLENGFKTSIWTNDNKIRMDIAEIVQSQLKAVNIDVEIKVVEWGQYLDGTGNGEHDMFILGWTTVIEDPDYGLYALFHSSQFGDVGNRTFYSNAKVDELLDKGRVETDPETRKAYYLEVQKIIRDDSPWIFLNIGQNLTGTRSKVKGFSQHPTGHHQLSEVYLE